MDMCFRQIWGETASRLGAESIFKEAVDVAVIQSNDRGSQRQRDAGRRRVKIHTDASLM